MQKKAPVYNCYYSSQSHRQTFYVPQVGSHKETYLQRVADRTGDPILTSWVFHAIRVILRLKLRDQEGLSLHPWPPSEEDPALCPA